MNNIIPIPRKQTEVKIKNGNRVVISGTVKPTDGSTAMDLIKKIRKASQDKIFPSYYYNV